MIRTPRPGIRAAAVATAITGLATLTACSGSGSGTVTLSGSAHPAAGSTTAVSTAGPTTATPEPSATTTEPATDAGTKKVRGCSTDDDLPIPKGAGTAKTADLDGDGRKDTIWLADDGAGRAALGVRTAGGAGFATRIPIVSDTSQAVRAVAGVVSGGVPVILVDNGTVSVFSAAGCEIRPTQNKDGDQYTFRTDGTTPGYDSGVGCVPVGSTGLQLVGYHAQWYDDGAEYKVTRTTVKLSEDGVTATNGSTTTVKEVASDGDPVLTKARAVTCTGSTAKL